MTCGPTITAWVPPAARACVTDVGWECFLATDDVLAPARGPRPGVIGRG
jgi:hypothetical protein